MTDVKRPDPDPTTWVDEHGDVLYRFALLRVKDPQVAEDVVQETFVSALQGLGTYEGASSVRTWLVGILKHKIIDQFRKRSREVLSTDLAGDHSGAPESAFDRLREGQSPATPREWQDTPDNLLKSKEFWKVFRRCLDALPPAYHDAFSLRELDGMTTQEICKILDVTPTNLWVILHRARGRLRGCLDANWFDAGGRVGT